VTLVAAKDDGHHAPMAYIAQLVGGPGVSVLGHVSLGGGPACKIVSQ